VSIGLGPAGSGRDGDRRSTTVEAGPDELGDDAASLAGGAAGRARRATRVGPLASVGLAVLAG
jgi:hypothetical protein